MHFQFDLFSAGREIIPSSGKSPCVGCPLASVGKRVPATIPTEKPLAVAIGIAPGKVEEIQNKNFVGDSGILLRATLTKVGIDPNRIAYLNTCRCRPPQDDLYAQEFIDATERCAAYARYHVAMDLKEVPLLLLGQQPTQAFLGKKAHVERDRGIWHFSTSANRLAFCVRHPAAALRDKSQVTAIQFRKDIQRFADRILGNVKQDDTKVLIYRDLEEAVPFLRKVAKLTNPWGFDVEAYDAKATPSRKGVATNPVHPDHRVLGCGFGVNAKVGGYIDLRSWESKRLDTSSQPMVALREAFASSAEKYAFNGSYDEESLIYDAGKKTGGFRWVPEIRNRAGDGMLAVITLGDNPQQSHSLVKAVVDILHRDQYWDGVSKDSLVKYPIEIAGRGCVKDAIENLLLCKEMEKRMKERRYL